MTYYLYLIAGLIILIAGGEFLVRGGVSLAGHLKISTLVVGVTVISFGTSAPELVVSLDAALSNHPDISLGNVIGSNISNIALVLGLTILITPYFVNPKSVLKDWIMMVGVTMLFILFLLSGERLSRLEGIVLFVLLVSFIWHSVQKSRREIRSGNGQTAIAKYSLPVTIIIIILASASLVLGADLLVKGASAIAANFGITERAISVSVIALGTSLPELATSAVAAARKENEISLGNIIGSNIFNLLGILGLSAVVKSIHVRDLKVINSDIWWMLGISILLFVLILPLKGSKLSRWKGALLVTIYLIYIYTVFIP
jgi:cation:H+ antiporter